MNLYERFEKLRVINAVGYATRVGGSAPSEEVIGAMQWAQSRFFEMDDLLEEASTIIAEKTGSEAGLVTCSASAALTLGAAAILVGFDPAKMDALPDTSLLAKRKFLYARKNAFDYDHPISAAGAEILPFSLDPESVEEQLSSMIDECTAGVVFVWRHRRERDVISRIGRYCRKHGVPFILDAAMGLPPAENLTEFYKLGPNLVALSGGKHLGGPQNSGLLFGDAPLVASAWLQMVDMDVRAGTWSLGRMLNEGKIKRPPRHGIGRGSKVGKDAILGCITALTAYSHRDFLAEHHAWVALCRRIEHELNQHALKEGLSVHFLSENGTGQYPMVAISASSEIQMDLVKKQLKEGTPKIILAEDEEDGRYAYIYPMCLSKTDADELIQRSQKVMWA